SFGAGGGGFAVLDGAREQAMRRIDHTGPDTSPVRSDGGAADQWQWRSRRVGIELGVSRHCVAPAELSRYGTCLTAAMFGSLIAPAERSDDHVSAVEHEAMYLELLDGLLGGGPGLSGGQVGHGGQHDLVVVSVEVLPGLPYLEDLKPCGGRAADVDQEPVPGCTAAGVV